MSYLLIKMSQLLSFFGWRPYFSDAPDPVWPRLRQPSALLCFKLQTRKTTSAFTFRRLLKVLQLLGPIESQLTKTEGSRNVVERRFPCEHSDSLFFTFSLFIRSAFLGCGTACGI